MVYKTPKSQRDKCNAWRRANRDKLRAGETRWRENNRDKRREYCRVDYLKHHAKRLAAMTERLKRPEVKERKKETDRLYYQKHKTRLRALNKEWKQKHPERYKELQKRWAEANDTAGLQRLKRWIDKNPEYAKAVQTEHARRRSAAILDRTVGDPKAIRRFYYHVRTAANLACHWCKNPVPKGKRHVDHVIPLAAGGQHALDNLVASCVHCNCKRGKKLPA